MTFGNVSPRYLREPLFNRHSVAHRKGTFDAVEDGRFRLLAEAAAIYHGALYASRYGMTVRVIGRHERVPYPFVVEFIDGFRGIARGEDLER